jgi:hypothetical protein
VADTNITDINHNGLQFTPSPAGYQLPVTPLPSVMFADNFNGTTIDTNRWATPVLAGTGTMTQAGGNLIATVGTTLSNGAAINSLDVYEPSIGSVTAGALAQIEASPTTNSSRCFGFYTRPGGFTAATPVQDGYVWEYDIAGTFGASIYNGGTRISRTIFALNGDTFVPFSVAYSGLNVLFYLRDFAKPVLSVPVLQPSTMSLPLGFHCINHTTGPATAPTWQIYGMAVLDGCGAIDTCYNGQILARTRVPGKFVNIAGVASGTTLWTPASGKRFRLMGYVLMTTTANGVLTLTDSGNSTVIPGGIIPLSITAPTISPPQGNGYLGAAVNGTITQAFTGGGALSGYLFGTEEG